MDINYLESLPPEIIFDILLRLPVRDILRFCQISKRLRPFCNEYDLWATKAIRDLNITRNTFDNNINDNPITKYMNLLNYNIYSAAGEGNLAKVSYLLSLGPTNINSVLCNAAFAGRLDVVKFLLQHGAGADVDDLNDALIAASEGRDLDTVRYLVNHGATDIDEALRAASYSGTNEIIDYLSSISVGEAGLE